MLPVQTVMIRYMVLVYRWGSGRLGSAGARGGALGCTVTGGCARRRTTATGPGREKAPPTWGRRGLLEVSFILICLLLRYRNQLEALQRH